MPIHKVHHGTSIRRMSKCTPTSHYSDPRSGDKVRLLERMDSGGHFALVHEGAEGIVFEVFEIQRLKQIFCRVRFGSTVRLVNMRKLELVCS